MVYILLSNYIATGYYIWLLHCCYVQLQYYKPYSIATGNQSAIRVSVANHSAIWIAASNHSAIWITGSTTIDLVAVYGWFWPETTVNMWQLAGTSQSLNSCSQYSPAAGCLRTVMGAKSLNAETKRLRCSC